MIDEYSNLFGKLMCDLLDIYQTKDWGLSWQSFLEQAKSEMDSKFKEWEEESLSKNKILFRKDFEDDWEHVIVYKNGVLIDDSLENHKLDSIDLLEYLSKLGFFELEIEKIE